MRWDLADRGGPFPWPESDGALFDELAGFLARLNETSLDMVMTLTRGNGKSAIHAVNPEDLSEAGQDRFGEVYRSRNLDSGDYGEIEVVSMDYCLRPDDPRRVVVLFNAPDRRIYPLWWDPEHEVTGSDGRQQSAKAGGCPAVDCYHLPNL